jgi:hypothetical protein
MRHGWLCAFIRYVLSCVQVVALRRIDPRPRSPTGYVKYQEAENAAKVQQKAVETYISKSKDIPVPGRGGP